MLENVRREGIKKCVFALFQDSRGATNKICAFLICARGCYMNSSMYFEMSVAEMSCLASGESFMNGISSV